MNTEAPPREGIPTIYDGVRFRSRLEARWAAFLDLCNRKWAYEPFDCDGYIPDFVLYGNLFNCAVEVKPSILVDLNSAQIRKGVSYAKHHGMRFLILTERLDPYVFDGVNSWHSWQTCGYQFGCEGVYHRANQLSLHCQEFTFRFDVGDKDESMDGVRAFPTKGDVFVELWKEAGNTVQWKKSDREQNIPKLSGFALPLRRLVERGGYVIDVDTGEVVEPIACIGEPDGTKTAL